MDMSYQEKAFWLLAVSLVAVFGVYFASVLPAESANVLPHQALLFLSAMFLLVVIQIVGHIVMAVADRRRLAESRIQGDERDKIIGLKGTRNGATVLAVGVFSSIGIALSTEGNFLFTHTLLAFWVVAQLVDFGSRLFLYRRGA